MGHMFEIVISLLLGKFHVPRIKHVTYQLKVKTENNVLSCTECVTTSLFLSQRKRKQFSFSLFHILTKQAGNVPCKNGTKVFSFCFH